MRRLFQAILAAIAATTKSGYEKQVVDSDESRRFWRRFHRAEELQARYIKWIGACE